MPFTPTRIAVDCVIFGLCAASAIAHAWSWHTVGWVMFGIGMAGAVGVRLREYKSK